MHHFTQRALTAIAALAATAALAAGAASPAHASAPPGTVTSTSANGMTYTASDDSSAIHITHNGWVLLVDDTVPLKAGAGCWPVTGDPTYAICTFSGGPITVSAGGGNDTVTNHTSYKMIADGGLGHDHLYGGSTADILKGGAGDDQLRGDGGNDQLIGGSESDSLDGSWGADTLVGDSGNDTLRGGASDNDNLDGGIGDDVLNGGDGEHDRVTYELRTADVWVFLPNPNDSVSPGNGEHDENDQITQVEDVRGSAGADSLAGNERDNRLSSHAGSGSYLLGGPGADILVGSDGPDTLFASGWLFGPAHDGAHDQLYAQGGIDECGFSTTDPDFTDQCE